MRLTRAFLSRQQINQVAEQAIGAILAGRPEQAYHEVSTTQNFEEGTPLAVGERLFRYCYAGTDLERNIGGFNFTQWPINAALTAAAVAGRKTMSVPEATAAADYYKGGWLVVFTANMQFYEILGNTASDGTNITLTLDRAIEEGAAIGTWVTGYPNIFKDVRAPGSAGMVAGYNTVVCVPPVAVAAGEFFWGQRRGPCYGVADGTVPGITADQRELFFEESGNLAPQTDIGAALGHQRAGYLLPRTENGSGDQFYWLQLE
jgi:hypothetical protein